MIRKKASISKQTENKMLGWGRKFVRSNIFARVAFKCNGDCSWSGERNAVRERGAERESYLPHSSRVCGSLLFLKLSGEGGTMGRRRGEKEKERGKRRGKAPGFIDRLFVHSSAGLAFLLRFNFHIADGKRAQKRLNLNRSFTPFATQVCRAGQQLFQVCQRSLSVLRLRHTFFSAAIFSLPLSRALAAYVLVLEEDIHPVGLLGNPRRLSASSRYSGSFEMSLQSILY